GADPGGGGPGAGAVPAAPPARAGPGRRRELQKDPTMNQSALATSTHPPLDVAPPRWRRWVMAGAVALAAAAVGVSFARPEAPPPAAGPRMVSDAQGVTLPSGAPQWRYVELAVAAEKPPLPPLPVPARIGLDEKRTASVGSPL